LKRVFVFGILFILLFAILIIYITVSRKVDTGKLTLSGVVEAEELDISFRISGLITDIYFKEGDTVDSGSIVAELDQGELRAAFDQASKNYEAAKAAITSLEVNIETVDRNPTSGSPTGVFQEKSGSSESRCRYGADTARVCGFNLIYKRYRIIAHV